MVNLALSESIVVKRSKRARRMALRLDTKDRVIRLVVPRGISMRQAESFASEHQDWIEDRLASLAPPVAFEDGADIPVLGQLRRLHITCNETLKRSSVAMKEKDIIIKSPDDDITPTLTRFLKSQAKDVMTGLAHEKAAAINETLNKLSVRDTKTRWGSCSEDGCISLSWRLIFAPYEAMDYVIAHEVAHLTHLDHSRAFWALCRSLSDDFVEGKYWMDNHGHELMAYGANSVPA